MGYDCDNIVSKATMSEEKAQRAPIDVDWLADRLRMEQDNNMVM